MTARTHDAVAFASLVVIATYYPPGGLSLLTLFAGIVANNVGALLPDMDQAGNRLWDLLPLGDQVGKIFRRVFYKHRTLSHSLVGLFLIFNLLGWLIPKLLNPSFVDPNIVFGSIMVGYISHLVADAFTKEGLPILWPLPFEIGIPPFKFLRVTTDKFVEKMIIYPGIWMFLIWFIYENQERIKSILILVNS